MRRTTCTWVEPTNSTMHSKTSRRDLVSAVHMPAQGYDLRKIMYGYCRHCRIGPPSSVNSLPLFIWSMGSSLHSVGHCVGTLVLGQVLRSNCSTPSMFCNMVVLALMIVGKRQYQNTIVLYTYAYFDPVQPAFFKLPYIVLTSLVVTNCLEVPHKWFQA